MYIQDLAGVAHDDIDLSVFSISGDDQKVRCPPPPLVPCTLNSDYLNVYSCIIKFTPDH